MPEPGGTGSTAGARRGPPLALIVDDDEDMRRFLTITLKLDGFAIEGVGSGPEALEYMAEDPADLVIVDHFMPELTGLELATRLRDQGYDKPIVMFSAYMDNTLSRACERLNVWPLSKIDIEALRRVVRALASELRGGRPEGA